MFKKILAFILVITMTIGMCACGAKEQSAPTGELVVLYTNDIHCGIEEGIGFKGIAAIKNALENAGKTVILVDAGDAVQGEMIGTLSKGEYVVDIMNELGYVFAAVGNHDFDYGMDQLKKNAEKANYKFLSCNFLDKDGNTVFSPYEIVELCGKKIAFVGVSTPDSIRTSTPKYFMDENENYIYSFCGGETNEAFLNQVQKYVDEARSKGADYVFAISHLGIEADVSPYMSTELIAGTNGIDAVIDGHSHSEIVMEKVKNKDGNDVILTQTGTKLKNVGMLTIGADGTVSTRLISDNGVEEFISGILAGFEELSNTVVAITASPMYITDPLTEERMVRSNETNLGDFVTDAIRDAFKTDIAICNGGGIRADIAAGDITYGDIYKVQPFGNELCVAEVTGQQIADMLEYSVSALPGEKGGFLQVSGLTFTVDLSIDSTVTEDADNMFTGISGERRVKDIMIGGQPIDLDAKYTIAGTTYILQDSGDGYTMFKGASYPVKVGPQDVQFLIDYIKGTLEGKIPDTYADAYGSGRINIING